MRQSATLLLLIFTLGMSQSFTGGVKVGTDYTDYTTVNSVFVDSADYSPASYVPGSRQYFGVNAFGVIGSGSASLIIEATNDTWTPLFSYPNTSIQRFSFNWQNSDYNITVGDFFKNDIDAFISARPLRGARLAVNEDGRKSGWIFDVYGGQFERPVDYDQPLPGQYESYENGGIFQRLGGAFEVGYSWQNSLRIKLEGLYAKDLEESISASTVKPLANTVAGLKIDKYFNNGRLNVGVGAWFSQLDSLAYLTIQEESVNQTPGFGDTAIDSLRSTQGSDFAGKAWIRYSDSRSRINFELYRYGSDYYTAGNPYLLTDRIGGLFNGNYGFTRYLAANIEAEYYTNNLKNSDLYPQSRTIRVNPRFILSFGDFSFSTGFPLQRESSDTLSQELLPTVIDRYTSGPEVELSYQISGFSVTYAGYFTQVDESSIIYGDSLFSTRQDIHNLNLFLNNDRLFLSLGAAASFFDANGRTSGFKNYGVYGNLRYQLIPTTLVVEANANFQRNDVDYLNVWEKVGIFDRLTAGMLLEYFFNTNFSMRLGLDYIDQKYGYRADEAIQIIALDGFDYRYFNGQGDATIFIPTFEINWLF
jgi:hypothetical protein